MEGGGEEAHSHTNLRDLVAERDWEVEVCCPVGRRTMVGQRKGVVGNLQHLWDWELNKHEKLFGTYWRNTFGAPSSLVHLLGKDRGFLF